ncbi:calcium homeostasis modulator protein 6-like [Diceros bicornis minor]|uniref:calcium homeostasis modulator protein 6-like n=1 Tax=Diceros bicornis minor TaxID=77932 RepID=UPI0026EB4025|nr:calcium homeostasis modulator protein 6-like [Diceros bicornis minor]
MEKFWTGLKLHLRYSTVPGYGLATMVTAGGERILFTVAFQCPCSLVFLLVPALALFLLCYVLSVRAWRLVTGCCELWSRAKVWTHLTWAGMLASLTWVAVALLGGAFYECGASGSTEVARRLCAGRDSSCAARLPLVPCQQAGEPDVQDLLRELRAQSQVRSWC